MSFRDFFLPLPPTERTAYAAKAGTSVPMLLQVAYGNKRIELGFADVLVAVAPRGALRIEDMPLTDRAAQQHAIRAPNKPGAPRKTAGAEG